VDHRLRDLSIDLGRKASSCRYSFMLEQKVAYASNSTFIASEQAMDHGEDHSCRYLGNLQSDSRTKDRVPVQKTWKCLDKRKASPFEK